MNKTRPSLPPGYTVADADHTPPFHLRLHGVRTDVLDWRDRPEPPSGVEAVAAAHSPVAQAIVKAGAEAEEARARQDTIVGERGAFASQEEAEAAAWTHWHEHADPAWVAYIEPDEEPVDLREPFPKAHAKGTSVPPFYRVEEIGEHDYSVYFFAGADDKPAELISVNGKQSWTEQGLAEGAAWADFNTRENVGDWPAYLASLDLREPFTGFTLSDPQREIADLMTERYAQTFAEAGQEAPSADTVILATHMRTFAELAAADVGGKSSKLVQAIFFGDSARSQATSLMLSSLLLRQYSAPYGSLNESALDAVNVLVAVLDIVGQTQEKRRKFGGVAKGRRPS